MEGLAEVDGIRVSGLERDLVVGGDVDGGVVGIACEGSPFGVEGLV